MIALVVTALVHLAVGAVVGLGWPRSQRAQGRHHLASVIILPREADEHRHQPAAGAKSPTRRSEPLPALSALPPAVVLVAPTPVAAEQVADLPMTAPEGGREDALAMAVQAYRRAVMAALEAQRRPIRQDKAAGGTEAGVVLFRIERSGHLLETSVVQSTGRRVLDRTALSVIRRAAPFPTIPDPLPDELAISVPVQFLAGHRAGLAAAR